MKTSIVWFRKCLRIEDNSSLMKSLKENDKTIPIFILDPFFNSKVIGYNRMRFLFESLQNLDENLKKRNLQLFVLKGNPNQVLDVKKKNHFSLKLLKKHPDLFG